MERAAIVVLAGTESSADLGRMVNALQAVKEFQDRDDDVRLIFDGAGTQWVDELEDPDHDYHALYESVKANAYACDYCAGAFGVEDEVEESAAEPLAEFEGHPSVRDLVAEDYEVITY